MGTLLRDRKRGSGPLGGLEVVHGEDELGLATSAFGYESGRDVYARAGETPAVPTEFARPVVESSGQNRPRALDLESVGRENFTGIVSIVDHEMYDALSVVCGSTESLDVDSGASEELADFGQYPGAIVDGDGDLLEHAKSVPRRAPHPPSGRRCSKDGRSLD
jgi:hypothetical protein